MIVVDLIGRLGNQMFQYAFAVDTANKYKTWFLMNPIYKNEINKWFDLDIRTKILLNPRLVKFHKKLLHYFLPKLQIQTQDGWENEYISKNKVHYEGFFQSEHYFQTSKESILKRFKIKKIYTELFHSRYGNIFANNKTLVIHIRRTDYVDFGSDKLGGVGLCLPATYYENCLENVENLSQYKIFCISDDLVFVKEVFKDRNDINFVNNEMIVDFQFLVNADICILANSSFAWWGAYLNPKKNKIIYAPEFWLGFKINEEYPRKIIPAEFKKIKTD